MVGSDVAATESAENGCAAEVDEEVEHGSVRPELAFAIACRRVTCSSTSRHVVQRNFILLVYPLHANISPRAAFCQKTSQKPRLEVSFGNPVPICPTPPISTAESLQRGSSMHINDLNF
jgi:hypothetical protein